METLWSSPDDVPYSAAWTREGVLVGTGSRGKLYRVDDDGRWELLATLPAEQVTGIVRTAAGGRRARDGESGARARARRRAGGARQLRLERQGRRLARELGPAQLGGRRAAGHGGAARDAPRQHRHSGRDVDGLDAARRAPGVAPSEKARFLQLRLVLTGSAGATPTVEAVSAAYLQRNLPPELRPITVHPPGEAFQKPISASGEPEILGLDVDPLSERAAAARPPAGMPPAISFSRKLYQHGLRTFSWQADDPNGDAAALRRRVPRARRRDAGGRCAGAHRARVRLGHRDGSERALPAPRHRVGRARQSARARAHRLEGDARPSRSTTPRRASTRRSIRGRPA